MTKAAIKSRKQKNKNRRLRKMRTMFTKSTAPGKWGKILRAEMCSEGRDKALSLYKGKLCRIFCQNENFQLHPRNKSWYASAYNHSAFLTGTAKL